MTPLALALVCVFLQVALTFWAIVRVGMLRVAAVNTQAVTLEQIALSSAAYPPRVIAQQNNMQNQFETPVLLYSVVALAAALNAANWGLAAGAAVFVALRFVHRYIHVGRNDVVLRLKVYVAGLAGLSVSWLSLGVALFGG